MVVIIIIDGIALQYYTVRIDGYFVDVHDNRL